MESNKIDRLCLKARQAIQARAWQKAKQAYLLALGIRSDAPDIHMGLATVFFQLRELTSAAHHFREVTRLDPLRASAYINLGAVLNVLGDFENAVAALRRGLQLDPQCVEGYYNLGVVYRRNGQLDLAVQAYREALRLNPRLADAYHNLANLYAEKQQYRQALHNYEQALKVRPNWDKALEGRAHVQALLSAENQAAPQSVPLMGPQNARETTPPQEMMVDPSLHAALLTALHTKAEVVEELGRHFQQVLGDEMQAAIKELSSTLLHPNGTFDELGSHIHRFEQALEHVLAAQRNLETGMNQMQQLSAQIP